MYLSRKIVGSASTDTEGGYFERFKKTSEKGRISKVVYRTTTERQALADQRADRPVLRGEPQLQRQAQRTYELR